MISWPLVPPILDILMPLNESRKRMFIYPAYYFVDHEKYYDILAVHMVIVMCMTGFVYCACDANYVYAVQHACGLLAITRYRFRNVSEGVLDHHKNDAKLSKFNYRNVCKSIQAHQHALRYLKLIETNHHTYLFISVGMLIMCICVSLLQVANEKNDSWLVQCIFLFAQLFHTLILTGQGQFVINGLDGVFISIATFEKRFLRITKIFGKLSGIWPDQNKVKFSLWAMVHITMASFVFVQVARVVHIGTLKVVIEQSSIIGTGIVMVVKHGNYILNAKKLKSLLNDMSEDWAIDRLKEEVAIMTTYACRGTTLAMFYLVNACICAFLFLQLPWTVRLMHMIKPHNTSLPMVYAIPAYYFVEDDRKYYYYIQMYLGLSIYIVVIVFVGCDTCYMVLVQHACGLLTVAGYRFKNAINDFPFNTRNPEKEAKEINKRLRFSIQGHQRAIMFLTKIESAHVIYLLLCMGIIVLCLSITMVQITTMEICLDFYKFVSFLILQFLHLFCLTMQGQFIINSSDMIYNAIYEASWYNANPKTQALYILALRRSLTPRYLTAGGLIELNMRSFSEVIKLCVSYYTVLRST
ncbi:odorant receptor 13a-like [Bombus flavifrons]|uniref:odorant receptor 13a-like n=1 Tax=Bombus flavifrons TaxID=103934 RepID=UPI003704902F